MAFTTGELVRIRAELGFNVLTSGAAPWVNVTAYFETIVQNYITAGASTTSSTAVDATDEPTLTNIDLDDATDFHAGDRVWIGVGDAQETSIVQNVNANTIALKLTKQQVGTYPVYVDGGEQIVRDILERIRACKVEMSGTFGEGALKRVDEIEFYQVGSSSSGNTLFDSIAHTLMYWRDELASVLGVANMWRRKESSGSSIAVY